MDEFLHLPWEAWTAIGTVALALITLGLAIATYKLFRATVDLARDAKKSAEAVPKLERAYVFAIVEGSLHHTPSGTLPAIITVTFTNHGRTPALIKGIYVNVFLDKSAPPKLVRSASGLQEIPSGLVIGAGKDLEFKYPFHLNDFIAGELDRGESIAFCLGEIEYEDVLNGRHVTGFCWESNGRTKFRSSSHTHVNHFS